MNSRMAYSAIGHTTEGHADTIWKSSREAQSSVRDITKVEFPRRAGGVELKLNAFLISVPHEWSASHSDLFFTPSE
jgi:hypothetical protein